MNLCFRKRNAVFHHKYFPTWRQSPLDENKVMIQDWGTMLSVAELSDTDGNVQGAAEYVMESTSSFYLYIPLYSTLFSLE